jgi:hypothetical protein
MYTDKNYQSKKALRDDLKAGKQVTVFQPNAFGPVRMDGRISLEGPHYPQAHKWYASVEITDGVVTKFIS